MPQRETTGLQELAAKLLRQSSILRSVLHPTTSEGVKELLRSMNSYYSNLIEGQSTHPIEIDKALKKNYEQDSHKKNLQKLAIAHIETQKRAEAILTNKDPAITHPDFILFLHKEFYSQLPDDFLEVEDPSNHNKIKLIPGKLRQQEVVVGQHLPPRSDSLIHFLNRFHEVYSAKDMDPLRRIIAGAAAHHRLAWIHPFLDGNGRVVRLFSDSFFMKEHLGGFGLWTISRGLARNRQDYYVALMSGDEKRRNDYDGRGALSDQALTEFCYFFLSTALDQITFMTDMLNLDFFEKRLHRLVGLLNDRLSLKPEAFYLLRDLFLRGHIPRGEAGRIMNLHERVARSVVSQLAKHDLVKSKTPKSDLQLNFSPPFASFVFPNLYPENLDLLQFLIKS